MKKLKGASIGQPDIEDLKLLSVKISKKVSDSHTKLLGTGTIVCDGVDFYVLSAAHCFRDKEGNQNCEKSEVVLTLYDEKERPINLYVIDLDLSDVDKDTAIIPIKTPPAAEEYFEKLKLLGQEINGHDAFVFGYTEKRPKGRLFTYKRKNIGEWANQDNITEKDEDFYKTVKGSSGGGLFIEIDDQIYCMGFVKSTFDSVGSMDEVKVQPMNLYKNWGAAYFDTIDEAMGKQTIESGNGALQKECMKRWQEVYDYISRGENLRDLLPRLNEIRRLYSFSKNNNVQNETMSLLFRRQEPWPEDYQDVFLMALEDQGMWPSIYGDAISEAAKGISDRPLAKKLEHRGVTLTKAPFYEGVEKEIKDGRDYYEQILRYAFALDFTSMKKLVMDWDAKGFETARKAMFVSLFEKNKDVLVALNEYLKNQDEKVENEKFIATTVYNVVNGDIFNRKSYEPFLKEGLDGISVILAFIADRIVKHQEKVNVYGVHHRYFIGGDGDHQSMPEAMRLLRTIIESGVLTSFRFTYFVSQTNWLKVVNCLFRYMPYPILFYTLMYSDEKLLRRVGQEYAYTDDEDVIKALPDIQLRLLKAIGNPDTPHIFIGLYLISAELYVALKEEVWYEAFRDHVLCFFCKEDVLKNVSHRDPIFMNVSEGIKHVKDVGRRIEIFKILTSVVSYNSYLVNVLIYDNLKVDETLMLNDEFLAVLMDVIKSNPLKDTYMIASKTGRQPNADERLRDLIDAVAKADGLDFGSETCNGIGMLSAVVRDEETRRKMRGRLLKEDVWNCGVKGGGGYTEPRPLGLEMVDTAIGWTVRDWEIIRKNMLANIALIDQKHQNRDDLLKHFRKQYIDLLSNMKFFIKNIEQVKGCDVNEVSVQVDKLLIELRGYHNIMEALSTDDYDEVTDGIWSLKDKVKNGGVRTCKVEIALLINRVMLQTKEALEACMGLLAGIVEYQPRVMAEDFGEMLLELLKRYGKEFDYETLFVRKPNMYCGLRVIAKGMKDRYGNEGAVRYWLEDEEVNRFDLEW